MILWSYSELTGLKLPIGWVNLEPVVGSGRSWGRKFQGDNPYTPKKEFAYRMRTGPPIGALPKPSFLLHTRWWCDVVYCYVMRCSGWCDVTWLVVRWGEARWGEVIGGEVKKMWCKEMWLLSEHDPRMNPSSATSPFAVQYLCSHFGNEKWQSNFTKYCPLPGRVTLQLQLHKNIEEWHSKRGQHVWWSWTVTFSTDAIFCEVVMLECHFWWQAQSFMKLDSWTLTFRGACHEKWLKIPHMLKLPTKTDRHECCYYYCNYNYYHCYSSSYSYCYCYCYCYYYYCFYYYYYY